MTSSPKISWLREAWRKPKYVSGLKLASYALGCATGYWLTLQICALLVQNDYPWKFFANQLSNRPEQRVQLQLMRPPSPEGSTICVGDVEFLDIDCTAAVPDQIVRIAVPAPSFANYNSILGALAKSDPSARFVLQAPPWLWSNVADDAFGPSPDLFMFNAKKAVIPAVIHVKAVLRTVALAIKSLKPDVPAAASPIGRPTSLLNAKFEWPPSSKPAFATLRSLEIQANLQNRIVWIVRRSWLPPDTTSEFRAALDKFANHPPEDFRPGSFRLLD